MSDPFDFCNDNYGSVDDSDAFGRYYDDMKSTPNTRAAPTYYGVETSRPPQAVQRHGSTNIEGKEMTTVAPEKKQKRIKRLFSCFCLNNGQ